MDKFEEKEMNKISPTKVESLFNRNTPKQTMYGRGNKLSKPKTQNKIKKKEEKI